MRHTLTLFVLLLLGLLLAEPTAMAQVALTVVPSNQPDNILVAGSVLASSPLTQTTLTLTFPGPPGGVLIAGASGLFATVSAIVLGNTIQVTLPGIGLNTQSGSFRIEGFHSPACAPITLALSSLANNYLLTASVINQPPPLVITSVVPLNGIVQIRGNGGFCSPRVFLGQTELHNVRPLPTGDGVSAVWPANIPAGGYLLNVSRFSSDSNTFVVYIEAVCSEGRRSEFQGQTPN